MSTTQFGMCSSQGVEWGFEDFYSNFEFWVLKKRVRDGNGQIRTNQTSLTQKISFPWNDITRVSIICGTDIVGDCGLVEFVYVIVVVDTRIVFILVFLWV